MSFVDAFQTPAQNRMVHNMLLCATLNNTVGCQTLNYPNDCSIRVPLSSVNNFEYLRN